MAFSIGSGWLSPSSTIRNRSPSTDSGSGNVTVGAAVAWSACTHVTLPCVTSRAGRRSVAGATLLSVTERLNTRACVLSTSLAFGNSS